ncbi:MULTISPECIES: hypothetical protein [Methylobacterium]|nr:MULTISPECIES: hypothetical protein [Methylobacterium]
MKIVLKPMPQPDDGVCIGTLDGVPLTYRDQDLYAGERHVTMAEVGSAFVDAVNEAATAVLGHEWVSSLARLMQLNKRTTSRDRIAKFGLPEYVCLFLGQAAAHSHPRALGHALMCVEEIQEANTVERYHTGRPSQIDIIGRDMDAKETLRRALAAVDEVLAEREAFRLGKRSSSSLTSE